MLLPNSNPIPIREFESALPSLSTATKIKRKSNLPSIYAPDDYRESRCFPQPIARKGVISGNTVGLNQNRRGELANRTRVGWLAGWLARHTTEPLQNSRCRTAR